MRKIEMGHMSNKFIQYITVEQYLYDFKKIYALYNYVTGFAYFNSD